MKFSMTGQEKGDL